MPSIAHIIHPVIVDSSSDLVVAQPITFATMEIARKFAKRAVDVELFATQYHDEARLPLPDSFVRTPDMGRSINDIITFPVKRKLALIKDILDLLHENSRAEFFIYSNVDIALQPCFYSAVASIIHQGYDAFVINRRTISNAFSSLADLPLMYASLGEKHQGWDCFVFRRSLYPRFDLGNTIIGTGWFGRVMLTNMACLAQNFRIFEDLQLTFHIGNDRVWKTDQFEAYLNHNKGECKKILSEYDKSMGPLDRSRIPGRFFLNFK